MNSNKLSEILDSFLKDDSKAILFDGPWGCGKTYQIKEFIKNNKNIYYLSLFGLESIDEINTALYRMIHSCRVALTRSAIIVSKAVKPIPQVGNIADALEYQLSTEQAKLIKKKTIIIFDDLERLSRNIEYSDLLGYINSLFLSGCRIICSMSSDHISNEERINDFNDFKEKVFDRIYKVTESNNELLDSIFSKYNLVGLSSIYDLFDNNIRFALKTEHFFNEVLMHIKSANKSVDDLGIDNLFLLKGCIYCVKACFEKFKPEINKDNKIEYDVAKHYHEPNVVDAVMALKQTEEAQSDFAMPGFKDFIYLLSEAFLYKDYSGFEKRYLVDEELSNDILDQEFYYLSDANKESFIKEFERRILSNEIVWNDKTRNAVVAINSYTNHIFSDEVAKAIALLIFNSKDSHSYSDLRLCLSGAVSEERKKAVEAFITKIKETLNDLNKTDYVSEFESYVKEENYLKMRDFLDKNFYCVSDDKKMFVTYFRDNNFFFPDIAGDMDHSIWSYCHEVGRFVKQNEIVDDFIKYAKSMCKKNRTNKSLVDRFHAIIIYNIDNAYQVKELLDE